MSRALALGVWALVAAAACSAAGNAVSSNAGDAGAGDASAPDGSTAKSDDGAAPGDAGDAPDGAVDGGSSLACPPGSIAGFAPTWKPPHPLHSGACTAQQAELAVDCAFDPNSKPQQCDEFMNDAGNSGCTLCVLSDDFDTTYGPIVLHGAYAVLNLGGCIAQSSGDTSSTGCGAKVQAISDCEQYACSSCPDPSGGGKPLSDYIKCQSAAMNSACASFVDAGKCADPLIAPDGSASACSSGPNTFLDRARSLAQLFCVK